MTEGADYWRCDHIDGRTTEVSRGLCRPMEVQRIAAMELCVFLNRELAHDGRWSVGWTGNRNDITPGGLMVFNIPSVMVLVWLDRDDDVQFQVSIDERLDVFLACGPEHWCEQAEQAWAEWRCHIGDVGVKPEQTIKAAQGQREKDPTVSPDVS